MTKTFLLINGTSLQISFRFVCVRSHIQPWGLAMDIPCELPRIKNCSRSKTLVGQFLHRYAMKNIQVLATSIQMVVQDCTEAEENTDARDKFFMCVSKFAVPDWYPYIFPTFAVFPTHSPASPLIASLSSSPFSLAFYSFRFPLHVFLLCFSFRLSLSLAHASSRFLSLDFFLRQKRVLKHMRCKHFLRRNKFKFFWLSFSQGSCPGIRSK